MMPCLHCGKEVPEHLNYCDWDCHVAVAKAAGGKVHTPNGLPIGCIRHDNLMLECEGGDHPDYKFPATIQYIGPLDDESHEELHAVIYLDGSMALTLYECCYAMWSLRDGDCLGGSLWEKGEWQLDLQSIRRFLIVGDLHD